MGFLNIAVNLITKSKYVAIKELHQYDFESHLLTRSSYICVLFSSLLATAIFYDTWKLWTLIIGVISDIFCVVEQNVENLQGL